MSTESYIHAALPGSPGGPLLLLFHGTGGDEHQFVALGRELLPDAAIVSPRGDVSEFGAARFFRRTGEGVYDMDDLAVRTDKMAGFVRAHRDAAKPSAVDRPRLFERRQHPGLGAVCRSGAVRRCGADASADPVRAGDRRRSRGQAHPHHRRPPRSDLSARPDVAAGSAFARGRCRCHSGMARRRARGQAERDRGGTALPGAVRRADASTGALR